MQRLSRGSWSTLSSANLLSYTDDTCPANSTCVYRVRAVDEYGGSASPYTSDLATTMSFTAIQQNMAIAFAHFDQIRLAVNSIRAAHGDPDLSWRQILDHGGYSSGIEPGQGSLIDAVHLLALRDAMNKARAAVGVPAATSYTDTLSMPTPIRATHLTELQQRAQ